MRKTWKEWKEFLELPDSTVENEDEEFAAELNYLKEWEWGKGVDKRHAQIGAAVVLAEIKKSLEFGFSQREDDDEGDPNEIVCSWIRVFGDYYLDFNINDELKKCGLKIVKA
jgi:hypothetical protein